MKDLYGMSVLSKLVSMLAGNIYTDSHQTYIGHAMLGRSDPETYIKRQATRHDCLSSLLGDKDK
jgi:hypothetical protein